jgi:hypothetical protein
VSAADALGVVRTLQIAGRVVATVGRSSFKALPAGDLVLGICGEDGRAPDGSHIVCFDGLGDATRVLRACRPARQASRESAVLSLVGAAAGAVLATGPVVGARLPQVLTAINTAALVAVGNAVRHARQAEFSDSRQEPSPALDVPASMPLEPAAVAQNGHR